MKILLVGGTWSFRNDGKAMWHQYGSPYAKYLESLGHEIIFGYDKSGNRTLSFEWESEIGGIGGSYGRIGWAAAGRSVYDHCIPSLCYNNRISPNELLIINHSHGMNVALEAFAFGLQGSMISICGPVRHDMEYTVNQATGNINKWVSLHSDMSDMIQIMGSDIWPDGKVRRAWPESDQINQINSVGHSGLIDDPRMFYVTQNAINYITGTI